MIDLTINEAVLNNAVERARERGVIIPTLQQMADPETVPESVKKQLAKIGLWDINSLNLFRITWKNEPQLKGGQYGAVNYLEFPPQLTGVPCKIVALVGKWFPTGCHKVGASFGCLAPRLISGQFDPTFHKAVWPSTGNFCRGGAYNSALLGCEAIAILPQGMSQERFDWLSNIAGEVIATPGCESNVKEIFDKTWELRTTRDDVIIFNQFEELGNHLWHYQITGPALAEALQAVGGRLAGACFTSGSAGTLGAGDYLKEQFPEAKLAAAEALQCPTLLNNGYGDHRIEGIGDKHIPWIHNVRNTDLVIAIDDLDSYRLLRLFNEPLGRDYLVNEAGVPQQTAEQLDLLGISGIANLLSAIKMAKYYELNAGDTLVTVLTDSAEMYASRIVEQQQREGDYSLMQAAADFSRHLLGQRIDALLELTYASRKRIHNLKYYTWVEQQGRELDELNAQWYDYQEYWGGVHQQAAQIDALIEEFNEATGLLKEL